ncbi:MAG: lipocalin family protein [Lentisphaeria bacterium]|nr:lipocalin family protein [Lentisphaeria bacterium]
MKSKFFLTALAAIFFYGCYETKNIPAVTGFDLERYLGKWYEIYRLPNRFEQGMSKVSAEYMMTPDGVCKVINRGIRDGVEKSITGFVRFSGKKDTGELEVSFFRPFYGRYRIIKLAPDYRYSVVTSGSKDYLWILSRTPRLSADDWAEITAFLKQNNFPVDKLIAGQ